MLSRRRIGGLSLTEVLVASACFCVTLAPLFAMLAGNQRAANRRMMKLQLRSVAALVLDCVCALPPPMLQMISAEPAAPPLPVRLIVDAVLGKRLTKGRRAFPPLPRGATPPALPQGAAEAELTAIVAGSRFRVLLGSEQNIEGNRHLDCITVRMVPEPGSVTAGEIELRRLQCVR